MTIVLKEYDPEELNSTQMRFLGIFGNRKKRRVTEERIIEYYLEHVQRSSRRSTWVYRDRKDRWEQVWLPRTESEIRQAALNWFDRNLGKLIRTRIIQKKLKS